MCLVLRRIFKLMNNAKLNQKIIYILSCFVLSICLFGCKEKGGKMSILDGLPESTYLTEAKSAIENGKPIAIAFTAEWCPHCRHYKPTFFEVKSSFEDKATFLNIDVDDSAGSAISSRFQVKGIPTTAFVRADGSVYKVHVGGLEKDKLTEIINDLILSKHRKRGEPVAPFPIEPQEVKAKEDKQEVKPEEKLEEKLEEKIEVKEEQKEEQLEEKKDEMPQELIKQEEPAGEIKPEKLEGELVPELKEELPEEKPAGEIKLEAEPSPEQQ